MQTRKAKFIQQFQVSSALCLAMWADGVPCNNNRKQSSQRLVLNAPCLPQASDLRIVITGYPHRPEASCRNVLVNPGLLRRVPGGLVVQEMLLPGWSSNGPICSRCKTTSADMLEVDSNARWRQTPLILSCQHPLCSYHFRILRIFHFFRWNHDSQLFSFMCLSFPNLFDFSDAHHASHNYSASRSCHLRILRFFRFFRWNHRLTIVLFHVPVISKFVPDSSGFSDLFDAYHPSHNCSLSCSCYFRIILIFPMRATRLKIVPFRVPVISGFF